MTFSILVAQKFNKLLWLKITKKQLVGLLIYLHHVFGFAAYSKAAYYIHIIKVNYDLSNTYLTYVRIRIKLYALPIQETTRRPQTGYFNESPASGLANFLNYSSV